MSMASATPFSGLILPAYTAPLAGGPRPAIDDVGTSGGRIASTRTILRQALAWTADTPAMVGGSSPCAA